MTPFGRLLRLFWSRFFENDLTTPEGGFETNVYQVLGIIGTPGLMISFFSMPMFFELSMKPFDLHTQFALRTFRMFFPAFSFAVAGFAAFFEWEKLFPDRRDFYVLGPFPLPLRILFAARFSALCLFVLVLTAAVDLFPNLLVPVFSRAIPALREAGYIRALAAQIGATGGAAAFAFLAVSALQGVMINVTSPRIFRRISPWVQALGMSATIIVLLTFPVYSMMLSTGAREHARWLWYLPPVWFGGIYDLLLPPHDRLFSELGRLGLLALGGAAAIFCLAWSAGFQRHYRRTLESEDTGQRRPRVGLFDFLTTSPQERAIFRFAGTTLARSQAHRLFLASYWSVGISIGLLTSISVRNGHAVLSNDGVRSLPFLIVFFVLSGYRAAFQFPAELASNWIFRITEDRWAETSRRATRILVIASGLVPALIAFLPFEAAKWGAGTGLYYTAFQLITGALLVEILFWTFEKVPFTCSYYPGRMNLAMLVVIYLYGFTTYSFRMADLESSLAGNPPRAAVFFVLSAAALVILWKRKRSASEVMFDAREPEIQTLDLT